jgi:hypothetical protein
MRSAASTPRRPASTARAQLILLMLTAAALAASPAQASPIPPPPSRAACAATHPNRTLPPIEALDPRPGAPRVFAMQFKQDLRFVASYASFRTRVECLIREVVVPRLAHGRPNVVAFNEDVGLMTLATGTRGAAARALFSRPLPTLSCEPQGQPCGTLAALAAANAGYAGQLAAYRARFPTISALSGAFVAATDTFARGWMQTFSDMARRYGVYILGSNDQAPFRESTSPADITVFADPDLPRPRSVYVATSDRVYNEVFLWAPHDVPGRRGPQPLRNVVASNRKVPLTPIEQMLELAPGPSTGPEAIENLRPYQLPGTKARIGFATSMPAFVYGDPPAGTEPCSDTAQYYMRCLDALGANLVMQDEANPGRWATPVGWQPENWMTSTWRATSDPSVGFDYDVTPHMVGNLADLPFDGQTAITQRGLRGPGCRYVGNAGAGGLLGAKPEFLALAPWVVPDGPRDALRAVAARLAPGSGDRLENDYLETAIVADLPFPPDTNRPGCAGVPAG